jgi:hypothetical protein
MCGRWMEAWRAAKSAPLPQSSWMDWTRTARRTRRAAALVEGRVMVQKGDCVGAFQLWAGFLALRGEDIHHRCTRPP